MSKESKDGEAGTKTTAKTVIEIVGDEDDREGDGTPTSTNVANSFPQNYCSILY